MEQYYENPLSIEEILQYLLSATIVFILIIWSILTVLKDPVIGVLTILVFGLVSYFFFKELFVRTKQYVSLANGIVRIASINFAETNSFMCSTNLKGFRRKLVVSFDTNNIKSVRQITNTKNLRRPIFFKFSKPHIFHMTRKNLAVKIEFKKPLKNIKNELIWTNFKGDLDHIIVSIKDPEVFIHDIKNSKL